MVSVLVQLEVAVEVRGDSSRLIHMVQFIDQANFRLFAGECIYSKTYEQGQRPLYILVAIRHHHYLCRVADTRTAIQTNVNYMYTIPTYVGGGSRDTNQLTAYLIKR